MWVKVDYSTEAKKNPHPNMGGMWAIYTKKCLKDGTITNTAIGYIETIFPELLKESEDERIRKAISQCVEDMRGQFEKLYSVHHKDAIAWLERQGEQKPADKVEPKFHKGEWLCENEPNNYARFIQILETVNVQGKERYRISRDIHNDEDIVEFDFVEKYYHKFDIQDAKDGDVLNSMRVHATIIFKGFAEDGKHILAYCALQKGIFIKQEMLWDRDFEPASEY